MVGWSVGWLVGWCLRVLVGWLVEWFSGQLGGVFVPSLGWSVGRLLVKKIKGSPLFRERLCFVQIIHPGPDPDPDPDSNRQMNPTLADFLVERLVNVLTQNR